MSADNITICPKCQESELRENWSLGLNPDGEFSVEYRADCWACGFRWEFEQRTRLSTEEWEPEPEDSGIDPKALARIETAGKEQP